MKLPKKPSTRARAGAVEKMHKTSIWLPAADMHELRIIAAEDNTTMTEIIKKLIKDYLKRELS